MDDEAADTYRLVVFDFDGTLADTFDWFAGVINDVSDRYRFRKVAAHEVETLRAMDARGVIRHLEIPAWKLPLISRHMHRLAARDAASIHLFAGVEAMIAELASAGFVLAVVSSNTEANIRSVLGPTLAARFRHYACGASVFGKAKRLRAVMKAAGVAPSQTLAIGDEIRDGDAAEQAGCAYAAVAWGYTRADALASRRPVAVFEMPIEIAAFLGRPVH
jgi:phosphoglycolate phosphatase